MQRKPISLISHSDVRYRGILAGIDPAASTIQLSNGKTITYIEHCPIEAHHIRSVFYGNRIAAVSFIALFYCWGSVVSWHAVEDNV